MRIADANWFEVEDWLRTDDRAVVPLGSTEQHAHLSLSVDSILSERVAVEAAAPLGVPVFPAVAYGLTPYFMAYPGTVSLRLATYAGLVRDILDSLYATGFRRVLIVNVHGGNSPVQPVCAEWMQAHAGARCRFHDWWRAPRTWACVREIDPVVSHASWMKNFPWTRLFGREMPADQKPFVPFDRLRDHNAALGHEVMRLARAEGVRPVGFNGFDPDGFLRADRAAMAASLDRMVAHNRKTAKTHSGIWRDLAVRRRKTEVDAQMGMMVEIARARGMEMPVLARLIDLIHDLEDGRRAQSDDLPDLLVASCA